MKLWAGWPRPWRSGRSAKRVTVLMLTAMLLYVHVQLPPPWHVASPTRVFAHETATVAAVVDPLIDVVPEARVAAERAADELSAIRMDVVLDPAVGAIDGEMSVTWRNPASQPLSDVWFRLFPNAFYYGEGGLQVADVTVDGTPVSPELALEETALRVPLPIPISPGQSAEIAMTFTSTIPADSKGSYGIFNQDT